MSNNSENGALKHWLQRSPKTTTIGTAVVGLFILGQTFLFTIEGISMVAGGEAIGVLFLVGALLTLAISYAILFPRPVGLIGGLLIAAGWIVESFLFPDLVPIYIVTPAGADIALIVVNVALSVVIAGILIWNRDVFRPAQ